MALKYNPATGEMEEEDESLTSSLSNTSSTSIGPGLPEASPLASLYSQPSGPPVGLTPGLSSYNMYNIGDQNWYDGGNNLWYKKTGPEYNSDGIIVSGSGYDMANPITKDKLLGMNVGGWNPIPMTVTPDYNTESAWDSPLMGASLFMGGLGALGALPGITGAMAGEAATGAAMSPAAGLNFTPVPGVDPGSLGLSELTKSLGLSGGTGLTAGSLLGESAGEGFSPASSFQGSMTSPLGGPDSINILDLLSESSFAPSVQAGNSLTNMATGLDAISNYGATTPNLSPYTPDFGTLADAQAAVDVGAGQGIPEGYGMEGIGSTPAMDTFGSTNKLQSYLNTIRGGGMNMWDALTTPIGGGNRGPFSPPTPLGMAGRGLSALFDMKSNRDAMSIMERQFNAANNWTDPNRARGDEANRLWMQNYNDPMAGYNEFMTGAGREFTDQARAQAAKSGRRGAYLNSGKMQSDLASLFMKNQLQRGNALSQGFAGAGNNYAATTAAAPGYTAMVRNQYAPIGQAIRAIDRGFELSDIFGG